MRPKTDDRMGKKVASCRQLPYNLPVGSVDKPGRWMNHTARLYLLRV